MASILNDIERNKILAELLLKDNKRIFIKTATGDLYFGDILLVGDDILRIQCFAPPNKAGLKYSIYWASIIKLDECKERSTLR
jgi:hypothetical protein